MNIPPGLVNQKDSGPVAACTGLSQACAREAACRIETLQAAWLALPFPLCEIRAAEELPEMAHVKGALLF